MKKFFIIFVILLFITAGAIVLFFNYHFMPAVVSYSDTVRITIERGMSTKAITALLEDHGIVNSGKVLYYWLRYTKKSEKLQSGHFNFVKGEGVLSALEKLQRPETKDITITVQEGFTIEQTAARIESQIEIDTEEFTRLCTDPEFTASLGINAGTLEGYLFPDTYRLPEDYTEDIIIRRMVSRFIEVYSAAAFDPAIKEKYNSHQIITLASIVEKEATVASERGLIAGVFHNRLRLGWPLGADPTVRYIFRKFDGPLYVWELNHDSPYNTRRFAGLPPGPICSPGLAAIQASAKPEATDAMFFVARWDGSGEHDFSLTNEEHDRKKLQIRRENEERIRQMGQND